MLINKLRPTESVPLESKAFTSMRRIVITREKKMKLINRKEVEEREKYKLLFYN